MPVLRPVRWTEDGPFLEAVYSSTRAAELAMVPWSAEQKAAFCRMQFTAQHTDYQRNYPAAAYGIIERGGTALGRLYVDRRESEIHILDITLLPEHRGAGLGTRLLRGLQEEARAAGKALGIHVEKFNPALRLYERLGFRAKEDLGVYLLMEWRAA
ncbi:MAG: GNAT family N-acetyltransferase [Verrucomicrobia bacterium]|nr:GNAT family N-acetyltransferase [Verrucomicrobiota bacterium]